MQNPSNPKIQFRQVRDFGQIFNDVFRFIRLNFKSLFACLIVIPGVLYMIAGALYGVLLITGLNPNSYLSYVMNRDYMGLISYFLGAMLPYLIFIFLGGLSLSAVINRYIILYMEKEENDSITVKEMFKYLPGDMWRLFYNNLLLMLVMIGIMFGVVIIALIPILGALLIIVGLLLTFPQITYALTTGNYLVLKEKTLITTGYMKAWRHMKGNFWWTWLILFVALMLVGITGWVFGLPITILNFVSGTTRFSMEEPGLGIQILYALLGVIAIVGPRFLGVFTVLFSVFTYHSYEEANEGTGLKEKIDEIKLD